MREEDGKSFMMKILTAVDGIGRSPYQLRLGEFRIKSANNENAPELLFQKEMKSDIFNYITDISAKELFLDMSDFSRPSHNFQDFISDLTDDLILSDDENESSDQAKHSGKEGVNDSDSVNPNDKQGASSTFMYNTSSPIAARFNGELLPSPRETKARPLIPSAITARNALAQDNPTDRDVIGFEDIMFYVCLPDMNYFKEAPQSEIRRLFKWLKAGGVKTIRHLSIPDSTTNPMCDIIVHEYITKIFNIEKFDWRKLDMNLEVLTVGPKKEFTELTLYSSGNWSVLYHWASKHGLAALKKLKLVTINIVQLSPSIYKKGRTQHDRRSELYEKVFRESIEALEPKPEFELRINIRQEWNYPTARGAESKEPFVPNRSLQLLDQLDPCHRVIYDLRNSNAAAYQKLKELTQEPSFGTRDYRIKVAILDNGADRIRSSIRGQIAKGVSYVTGGPASNRILPWWMVSDPHGTQMASLIAKANPFCRLYIARVGRGRKDILPKHAAEAIDWAIKQNVDVISISWVMKKDHPELKSAINRAVTGAGRGGRPTLVFCSTADEGVYSGTIYPASYDGVVNVAATDQYGHMTPASANGVDILVPGENITADGPSYMEEYSNSRVSGSSVATATAAGIASLSLFLLKTYNWSKSDKDDEAEMIKRFYKRDGILGVFDKMNAHKAGVVPSKLFSGDTKELAEAWNHAGFEPRTQSSGGNRN
ncbi:peptidase S8/S53 domain-containing protein [Nemania sp. NC0429]|nr:peptidase S8/S53 domain-containing protein [Nemania sp. NC0429]